MYLVINQRLELVYSNLDQMMVQDKKSEDRHKYSSPMYKSWCNHLVAMEIFHRTNENFDLLVAQIRKKRGLSMSRGFIPKDYGHLQKKSWKLVQ